MTSPIEKTLALLDLEKIDKNVFSWQGENFGWHRIYGGQVMAQSLIAAYQTIEKKHFAHSFHSYFLRPGLLEDSILFDVDSIRDGKSFTTRRVRAIQNGEAIFACSISFQKDEKGFEHQIDDTFNDVPKPNDLPSDWDLRKDAIDKMKSQRPKSSFLREQEIEMRSVQHVDYANPEKIDPVKDIWMRPNGEIPKDLEINQALLLYASDRGLLGTAQHPHGINFMSKYFQAASLDHAMWFHTKIDFSNWFLHRIDSPIARNARGFARGSFYDQQGRLIASCAQEGLMRMWDTPKKD